MFVMILLAKEKHGASIHNSLGYGVYPRFVFLVGDLFGVCSEHFDGDCSSSHFNEDSFMFWSC